MNAGHERKGAPARTHTHTHLRARGQVAEEMRGESDNDWRAKGVNDAGLPRSLPLMGEWERGEKDEKKKKIK